MQMAEDRAKNPSDDIVTALIEADFDGEKLTDDEFGFFVVMLRWPATRPPATRSPTA